MAPLKIQGSSPGQEMQRKGTPDSHRITAVSDVRPVTAHADKSTKAKACLHPRWDKFAYCMPLCTSHCSASQPGWGFACSSACQGPFPPQGCRQIHVLAAHGCMQRPAVQTAPSQLAEGSWLYYIIFPHPLRPRPCADDG